MKREIVYVEAGGNQHAYKMLYPPLHPEVVEFLVDEHPPTRFSTRAPFVRVPCNWQIPLGP